MNKKKTKHKTLNSHANQFLVELLKEKRTTQGLSMRAVVENLGHSHSFVGKVENMDRRLDVIEFINYCNIIKADPVAILSRVVAEMDKT